MKKIVTLLVAALLVGCTTPEIKIETKYIFRETPAVLLITYDGVPPPNKEQYLELSCDAREKVWTDIYREQNTVNTLYRNQTLNQIEWNKQQKSLYEEHKGVP